jgi:hypothetical protein
VLRVNRAESQREFDALRRSANRSQPYGSYARVDRVTKWFDLESVFRPGGRPYKESQNNGS